MRFNLLSASSDVVSPGTYENGASFESWGRESNRLPICDHLINIHEVLLGTYTSAGDGELARSYLFVFS